MSSYRRYPWPEHELGGATERGQARAMCHLSSLDGLSWSNWKSIARYRDRITTAYGWVYYDLLYHDTAVPSGG